MTSYYKHYRGERLSATKFWNTTWMLSGKSIPLEIDSGLFNGIAIRAYCKNQVGWSLWITLTIVKFMNYDVDGGSPFQISGGAIGK